MATRHAHNLEIEGSNPSPANSEAHDTDDSQCFLRRTSRSGADFCEGNLVRVPAKSTAESDTKGPDGPERRAKFYK